MNGRHLDNVFFPWTTLRSLILEKIFKKYVSRVGDSIQYFEVHYQNY